MERQRPRVNIEWSPGLSSSHLLQLFPRLDLHLAFQASCVSHVVSPATPLCLILAYRFIFFSLIMFKGRWSLSGLELYITTGLGGGGVYKSLYTYAYTSKLCKSYLTKIKSKKCLVRWSSLHNYQTVIELGWFWISWTTTKCSAPPGNPLRLLENYYQVAPYEANGKII